MNDWTNKLKVALESTFLMPFDVSQHTLDGEEHYTCCPHNEDDMYFSVTVFIHNQIRLLVEIEPQKFGRDIINEMSQADVQKRKCFFSYIQMLKSQGGKVQFKVNNENIVNEEDWPTVWKSFSCKITKVPVEFYSATGEFNLVCEWMQHGVSLILSLLTIDDRSISSDLFPAEGEGTRHQVLSVRYERNPINRRLCLYKKGYNCSVCGTNLYEKYGAIGRDFIEVHHTTPVSMMGDDYKLDIDRDLVPLCPNCHAMIHRKTPPYTVEQLVSFWEEQNYGVGLAAEPFVEYNEVCNVIIGVVKKESIADFKTGQANLYYFGKKFPSKYNIKNIQYFAPYFEGGVRGYYDVISVRTARKAEIINNFDSPEQDMRIILDLGAYHHISDNPKQIKLASYTQAFISLSELLEK